jgi:hypothetical protein
METPSTPTAIEDHARAPDAGPELRCAPTSAPGRPLKTLGPVHVIVAEAQRAKAL